MALTQEQLQAIWDARGRDPSQREQVLASRNLLPTEYMTPNFLTYGNGVSFGQNGEVGLYPGKQYVLYDNRTGQQLASGSSAEEIQNILSIINNQLVPQGGKADWRLLDMGGAPTGVTLDMHTMLPSGFGEAVQVGDQYGIPIAGDRPNNFIKDMLIPLLTPIAATAGAYFGGNALLGAHGGGAAPIAGVSNATVSSNVANAINTAYTGAQAGASGALTGAGLGGGALAPAAAASTLAPVAGAAKDIVVTATGLGSGVNLAAPLAIGAGTAGGLLASAGGSGAGSTATSTPTSSNAPTTSAGSFPDEIVVTAKNATPFTIPPTVPVAAGTGLTAGLLANAQPTALPEVGPMDTPQKPGLLSNITKNLGISDYMTLASLVGSGVGSLFGSGGTGTQTPYVSPFGPVGGIGAGRDMRSTPNIADYEQYGFGPEATFFKPEYNQLVSNTFQPTTQAYRPLING